VRLVKLALQSVSVDGCWTFICEKALCGQQNICLNCKPIDRFGHRIDQIDYRPGYQSINGHAFERWPLSFTLDQYPVWAHVLRAALAFLHNHAGTPGSGCPLTMTFASVPAHLNSARYSKRVGCLKILSNRYA